MRFQLYSRICLKPLSAYRRHTNFPRSLPTARCFHLSTRCLAVKPFLLADIGEGIRECEIIQWFVEPEARVEEWDKLCEVQSDKASVEITSRFAGVIKKLHYEAGEMAKVGKPLVDIDIQGAVKEEDLKALTEEGGQSQAQPEEKEIIEPVKEKEIIREPKKESTPKGTHATLATPAVRHLTKELNVNISDVNGTGRDGRVLKDDVHQFARNRDTSTSKTSPHAAPETSTQVETTAQLTATQSAMYKSMTKSLTIPHFVYGDELNFTALSSLRARLNATLDTKISYLPFIIKAVSLMLTSHPALNARLSTDPQTSKPILINRTHHNIGVAMDTPTGLLVPVIPNVAALSIASIAQHLATLQALAATGKLTSAHLSGGTITVSNIGSIGGTYVSPVLVDSQLAILGIGKIHTVPAFAPTDPNALIAKPVANFSWSADHRVVDGASMARAAEAVKRFVEDPEKMLLHLR